MPLDAMPLDAMPPVAVRDASCAGDIPGLPRPAAYLRTGEMVRLGP
jgi:hypothetical protein